MNILKNRYLQIGIAIIIGGVVMKMCATEEIRIEEKEVVKWKTKIVEVEKEVRVVEKVERTTETRPDGTIIEKEVINKETDSETNIVKAEAEAEASKEKKVVHKNPRRTLVYTGIGVDPTHIKGEMSYLVGVTTTVWGPFNVGIQAAGPLKSPSIYGTFGFSF